MGIFRSNDPTVFDAVDGIVIDESAPPPSMNGVSTNIALLVGQFERGSTAMQQVTSAGDLYEKYGKNSAFSGYKALLNKKFGQLKILRVVAASGGAAATKAFADAGGAGGVVITAKYKGAYGNGIKVTIAAGSSSGSKYTISDTNTGAVFADEVYDNVLYTALATTLASSNLVVGSLDASADAEPAAVSATALASGSDGSIADTDYQTAIALAEVEACANVLFLDSYNSTRNGYLKTHAANTTDKMVIMCAGDSDDVSTAVSAVATQRDSEGRIIYAYNPVQTTIDGASVYQNPASWVASIISQTSPHVDPAYSGNTQFLAGITGLKYALTRTDFINLKNAGIAAFEFDADIGFKLKSGIVTQIADSAKLTIVRRRMADYLTASAGRFMKAYQNAVNSKANRTAIKGAILDFVGQRERLGMLPSAKDMQTGKPTLVDTESLNTDNAVGQGFCYVVWKQRIFSSMRYIVIKAEIGETVSVTAE
jgi:hypothetical protein